jgi:hypothetical protein
MTEMVDDIIDTPVSERTELLRSFTERLKDKKILDKQETLDGNEGTYDVILLHDSTQLIPASKLLMPGGAIMLAVRNASGMAALWGGATSGGVEKPSVSELARKAGFRYCSFYYPFPDPESPHVLISEAGFEELEVGNLIEPVLAGYPPGLARRLVASKLIIEVSDYFFVVVSDNPSWLPDPDILAWTYNPGRTTAYKKMNTIYRDAGGTIRVRRQALGTQADGNGPVRQVLSEEAYVSGRLYSLELVEIMSVAGWSAAGIAAWAERWVELLRKHVMATVTGEWLEGRYLDLVPFNVIDSDGRLEVIDLEWVTAEFLPLCYVLFRGLYHSLARVRTVALPAPGTPINLYGLCLEVASRFFDKGTEILETFVALEPHYFGEVFDGDGAPPGDVDLSIRPQEPSRVASGAGKLYPLTNLTLQVFVESPDKPFSEETSAVIRIALTPERTTYTIPLPNCTPDVVRIRIDPNDHSGLMQLHTVCLRSGEQALFCWTPFSQTEAAFNGVMILNAPPTLPDPVMVLLNYDPMLIFPLPAGTLPHPEATVMLEVEVSKLGPGVFEAMRGDLASFCELLI